MRRIWYSAVSGMSFIETVVALTVAAILSVLLYQLFYRSVQSLVRSDALVDDYTDILILASQLERDFAGIYNPSQEPAAKEGSSKAQQPFLCKSTGTTLTSLSICTTSALPTVDQPAARLVRVTYTLTAQARDTEEQRLQLSALLREEAPYRPTKGASSPRPHVLMAAIDSITCTCYYRPIYAQDSAGTAPLPNDGRTDPLREKAEPKRAARAPEKRTTWDSSDTSQNTLPPLPEYVEFSGNYVSRATHTKIPFSFIVPIPIAATTLCREEQAQEKRS